jgi:hypothetical protein
MYVEEQIKDYIAGQSETKRDEQRALHRLIAKSPVVGAEW